MNFLLFSFVVLSASLMGRFGFALLFANQIEAEKNASRTKSLSDAIMGRVQIHDDWLPDARVQGGMVFNKRENRIEICGRLSDESIERTFEKRSTPV